MYLMRKLAVGNHILAVVLLPLALLLLWRQGG
jgi:hypothetical protein